MKRGRIKTAIFMLTMGILIRRNGRDFGIRRGDGSGRNGGGDGGGN